MRLVAVPLARSRHGVNPISTFVAQRAAQAAHQANAHATSNDKPRSKAPLSTRLLQKASAFWIDLGRTDQTSTLDWKRRTYVTGERLMDRIEYQEWALKGIDPAMDPNLLAQDAEAMVQSDKASDSVQLDGKILLLYPPTLLKPEPLVASLKNLTDQRTPHHYRRFWFCVAGMPFTIPFALVPVIPNLPFFYLVYRAWSHWKAYKSSAFLSGLLADERLLPRQSPELDSVFAIKPPTVDTDGQPEAIEARSPPPPSRDERMLLQPHHIDLLLEKLHLPETAKADLRRARLQIERSMLQGKLEELESNSAGLK